MSSALHARPSGSNACVFRTCCGARRGAARRSETRSNRHASRPWNSEQLPANPGGLRHTRKGQKSGHTRALYRWSVAVSATSASVRFAWPSCDAASRPNPPAPENCPPSQQQFIGAREGSLATGEGMKARARYGPRRYEDVKGGASPRSSAARRWSTGASASLASVSAEHRGPCTPQLSCSCRCW